MAGTLDPVKMPHYRHAHTHGVAWHGQHTSPACWTSVPGQEATHGTQEGGLSPVTENEQLWPLYHSGYNSMKTVTE